MQRRIKRSWRGERVTFYQRVDGRWRRILDRHEAEQLWEQFGGVPVFLEYDLPNDDRSQLRSR